MGKRFTITEKWEDRWFWKLKPTEKLLWNYLCDKCDLAGFWEINLELASFQTKIKKSTILGAFQGLSRGYLTNEKYIWLRTFIRHQGNFPLNPANNAHKHIIGILEGHHDFGETDFFQEIREISSSKVGANEGLNSPPSNSNSKGNGKGNSKVNGVSKFVPPTLSELQSYITEKNYNVDAEKFLEYFTEANWIDKVGDRVRNWKLKVISWSNRNEQSTNSSSRQPAEGQAARYLANPDSGQDSEPYIR